MHHLLESDTNSFMDGQHHGVGRDRESVMKWVDSPLGFFTLSLLICESFLSIVLTLSKLSEPHQFAGMWVGAGIFILLVLLVTALVWWKPTNVVFDRHAHMSGRKSNDELADEIISVEYSAYMGQKSYVQAEFACRKALYHSQSNERAMISLALVKSYQNDYIESLNLFREAISRYPTSAKAYFNQGCIRAHLSTQEKDAEKKKKLVTDAVKDLKKALKFGPWYKNLVLGDEDLKKIAEEEEFKRLIASLQTSNSPGNPAH